MLSPEQKLHVRLATENVLLCIFMLIMLVVSCISEAFAQDVGKSKADTTAIIQVETKDGNKFVGHKVSETSEEMVLSTENLGAIRIQKSTIIQVRKVEVKKLKADGFWFDNAQATRHFFAPTGYNLRPGEAYYQNIWVVINQFSVGITQNVSFGVGFVPTFLFGSKDVPIWVTPKVSIPVSREKVNLGVGGMIGTTSTGEKGNGFGILYGVTTFGSRDNNVTLGAGVTYSGSKFADKPMISFSALQRISAKGYFITENYLLPQSNGNYQLLISLGGRRLVNRTGIDFGLFIPASSGNGGVAIPWLGITAPLDKRY